MMQGGAMQGAVMPPQAPGPGAMNAAVGSGETGNQLGLQLAVALSKTPTPQMAQQIIQQMQSAGMPEAEQIAELLQQAGDDPAAIKQLADIFVQELSK